MRRARGEPSTAPAVSWGGCAGRAALVRAGFRAAVRQCAKPPCTAAFSTHISFQCVQYAHILAFWMRTVNVFRDHDKAVRSWLTNALGWHAAPPNVKSQQYWYHRKSSR